MTPEHAAEGLRALAHDLADDVDAVLRHLPEVAALVEYAAGLIEARSVYERAAQFQALRIIITRAPQLAPQAATVMQEPDDRTRCLQVDRLVPLALRAAAMEMTDEERGQLAAAMLGGQGVSV